MSDTPTAVPAYRRMRGRSLVPFFSAGCWLADDHLLYVEVAGFVERYRRFHFRDIEAIVVLPNTRANLWALVWSLPLLVGLAILIPAILKGSAAGVVAGAIVLAVALLPMIVHLARGPMCTTVIQTRINRQALRSLGRRRDADRAVEELRPLIEQAQGAYAAEAFEAARWAGQGGPAAAADPGAAPVLAVPVAVAAPARPPPRLLGAESGLWHRVLCVALWVETLVCGLAIGWRNAPMTAAVLLVGLVVFGLGVTVLARQATRLVPAQLRAWAWTLFAYVLVRGVVAYGWGLVRYFSQIAERAGKAPTDWAVQLMDVWVKDSRFLAWFYGVVCIVTFFFGLSGTVLLRRHGDGMRAPAPPPLPPPPDAAEPAPAGPSAVEPEAGAPAAEAGSPVADAFPPPAPPPPEESALPPGSAG